MNVRCLLLNIRDAEPRDARADGCLGAVFAKMDQLDDVALQDDRTRKSRDAVDKRLRDVRQCCRTGTPTRSWTPRKNGMIAPYPDAQNESVTRDIPNHLC